MLRQEDNLNEYFSNLAEFTAIAKTHLFSKNFDEFEVWFEKLYKKDKRALFMFLKENRNKIDSKGIEFSEKVFNRSIAV